MNRHTGLGSALAAALLLAACVSSVGDYSEFATRGKPAVGNDGSIRFAAGRYQGGLRDGRPDGEGSFTFDNGIQYRGGFSAGRAQGQGETRYPDGRIVRGEYRDDVEHDTEIAYPDGRRYQGEVVKGRAAGAGVMQLPNGDTLTARFRDDRAEGSGLLQNPGGEALFSGAFRNGKPQGEGICKGATCYMDQGQDITAQTLQGEAEKLAERQINRDFDKQQAALKQETQPQVEAAQRELEGTRSEATAWRGPKSGDPCYCAIVGFCLTVEDANITAEQRALDDITWQRKKAQCWQEYSAYRDNKSSAGYAEKLRALDEKEAAVRRHYDGVRAEQQRRDAEIEAGRQRMLADKAERERLARQAAAKAEAERAERLRADKERCANGGLRTSPCRCRALLGIKETPKKGSACEA
jgi:hypothetical protein